MRNLSENYFLNFYFLNVDISLVKHGLQLQFCICIDNITGEGTVSQNFDIGPGSVFRKFRKKYFLKIIKSYPFFDIK